MQQTNEYSKTNYKSIDNNDKYKAKHTRYTTDCNASYPTRTVYCRQYNKQYYELIKLIRSEAKHFQDNNNKIKTH